jgi:hypothetical protein
VSAKLLHNSKLVLNSGLVREIKIWQIPKNFHYPEGVKYRLVLVDPVWKKVLLLFDNQSSKGHHWHDSYGNEYIYKMISVATLIEDFLRLEEVEEKNYESNEN